VIQERYPAALLPEPLLSILSRSFIPSEDALAIIIRRRRQHQRI